MNLTITSNNREYVPLTADGKYAIVLGTIFAYDVDASLIDTMKRSKLTSLCIFPMDITDGYDRYKEGLTNIFKYIIYENQNFIGNTVVIAHNKELQDITLEVIHTVARKISSTHKMYPTEDVMMAQPVTAFKGSTGDPNTKVTAFARCSQETTERQGGDSENIYYYKIEDTDLAFEFRKNYMLGNMSTGVNIGTFSYHCKREWVYRTVPKMTATSSDD